MENRSLGNAIGEFISKHPFMTWGIVGSIINAPAAIIRAIKWDGKETHIHYNYSSDETATTSNDTSEEAEESE